MQFSDSTPNTPRTPVSDRKFRSPRSLAEIKREEKLEHIDSKFDRASNASALGRNKHLNDEDDRRSKITIVSLRSNRTSRTVQTIQSSLDNYPVPPPSPQHGPKRALHIAKKTVKAGFRESSIKRIIASGLCLVTFLMLLFGVFLPFWNVYTYTIQDVATGYYGGLWTYCTVVSGDRTCSQYTESSNEHYFRATRAFELMAFFGMLALVALVVAYMFFLREIKYIFVQWIIIGLSFGTGLFILLGLIIFGASYSDSSHISSAYGLTLCAFFGCLIVGGLFLWDKMEMDKSDSDNLVFRGMSGARSSRSRMKSRMSQVKSTRSHAQSQRSRAASQMSGANSIALSNIESNAGKSIVKSTTGRSGIESRAGKSTKSGTRIQFKDKVPPIQENKF